MGGTGGGRAKLHYRNGKVVREPTTRTGHKKGQAPQSELHFRIEVDKSYDLRKSVSDMRRAINYIRNKKRKERQEKDGTLSKAEGGKVWDVHTNTERWDHLATDLARNDIVTVDSRSIGHLVDVNKRQTARDKKKLAEQFRKQYDLWGVRSTVDELTNPWLVKAGDVRRAKEEEAAAGPADARDIDTQFRDALFMEDVDTLMCVRVHVCM